MGEMSAARTTRPRADGVVARAVASGDLRSALTTSLTPRLSALFFAPLFPEHPLTQPVGLRTRVFGGEDEVPFLTHFRTFLAAFSSASGCANGTSSIATVFLSCVEAAAVGGVLLLLPERCLRSIDAASSSPPPPSAIRCFSFLSFLDTRAVGSDTADDSFLDDFSFLTFFSFAIAPVTGGGGGGGGGGVGKGGGRPGGVGGTVGGEEDLLSRTAAFLLLLLLLYEPMDCEGFGNVVFTSVWLGGQGVRLCALHSLSLGRHATPPSLPPSACASPHIITLDLNQESSEWQQVSPVRREPEALKRTL